MLTPYLGMLVELHQPDRTMDGHQWTTLAMVTGLNEDQQFVHLTEFCHPYFDCEMRGAPAMRSHMLVRIVADASEPKPMMRAWCMPVSNPVSFQDFAFKVDPEKLECRKPPEGAAEEIANATETPRTHEPIHDGAPIDSTPEVRKGRKAK